MRLRDAFRRFFNDRTLQACSPTTGQPAALAPVAALVTIFQFLENLTDRQAADAVRRVDWKYALALGLKTPGFDFSVLSEFRLIEEAANPCSTNCSNISKAEGSSRSRVQAAYRLDVRAGQHPDLNRAERVGET